MNHSNSLQFYSMVSSSYTDKHSNKKISDSNPEDDEAYGHTQMLSTQPESLNLVDCNQVKQLPEVRAAISIPPMKKPKFGLPGITAMPPKSSENCEQLNSAEYSSNIPKENTIKERIKPKFGLPSIMNKSQSFPDGNEKLTFAPESARPLKHSNSSENIYQRDKQKFNLTPNDTQTETKQPSFKTAHEQWVIDNQKRFGKNNRTNQANPQSVTGYGTNTLRSLGIPKITNNFKPPVNNYSPEYQGGSLAVKLANEQGSKSGSQEDPPLGDDRLKGIDSRMVETIQNGKLVIKQNFTIGEIQIK